MEILKVNWGVDFERFSDLASLIVPKLLFAFVASVLGSESSDEALTPLVAKVQLCLSLLDVSGECFGYAALGLTVRLIALHFNEHFNLPFSLN